MNKFLQNQMTKILLIIDAQYGFIEGGNLPVDGAMTVMNKLADFIRENGPAYNKIFLTADWHPHTHCSFKNNGGMWPEHCVQFTHDAAIYQPIIDALNAINADYIVMPKGIDEDHEEYSVFKNESSKQLITYCELNNVTDVDSVGIALNYCVKNTVIDAKKELPNINIHVLKDFCPAIGDPHEALVSIEHNGIEII